MQITEQLNLDVSRLDDATLENGCMWFIPGSHKSEVRSHRHIDHDPTVHGLVTDDVDPSAAVSCPWLQPLVNAFSTIVPANCLKIAPR